MKRWGVLDRPATGLHPDFGSGLWNGGPIGIPFDVVSRSTARSRDLHTLGRITGAVLEVVDACRCPTQGSSGAC